MTGKAGGSEVECGVNQIKRELRVMRVGDIMKVDIVQLVLPEGLSIGSGEV